jgi:hypothetical protein
MVGIAEYSFWLMDGESIKFRRRLPTDFKVRADQIRIWLLQAPDPFRYQRSCQLVNVPGPAERLQYFCPNLSILSQIPMAYT